MIIENMQPAAGEPRYMLFSKGADSTIMSKLDRAGAAAGIPAATVQAREAMIARTDEFLR